MKTLKRHIWLAALALGIVFIAVGTMFMVTGLNAKDMIASELIAQNVTLGKDAVEFGGTPGDLVSDASTAEIQAKIIALHTDGEYGIYSSLDRDDPHRADILKGLALRNSLNMAVMGYGIANLAIGTGVVVALMGAGTLALLAPVLYLTTAKEEHEVAVTPAVITDAPAASAA